MKKIGLLTGTAAAVLLAGVVIFNFSTVKIRDMNENPKKYIDKTVRVRGSVKGAFNFVVKSYLVDDGTGEIMVFTKIDPPKEGKKVTVKGKVKEAMNLFDKSALVIEEE